MMPYSNAVDMYLVYFDASKPFKKGLNCVSTRHAERLKIPYQKGEQGTWKTKDGIRNADHKNAIKLDDSVIACLLRGRREVHR